MKSKIIFTILLLLFSQVIIAQRAKVAVYMTGDDPINDIVGSRLVDGLARNGKYTAVERTASFLKALSKEHSYERGGSVDDSQIAVLGRQFSVQFVCVASVVNVWQNEKYITARVIDVESAEVVASGCSSGSILTSKELVDALDGLSENFLKSMERNKNLRVEKVAVYVTKTGNRDVDIILGDQLVAGFARSGKYIAIERTSSFLKQLSHEQGYQYSGAVDDAELTRLGKQFGVQYVCVAKTTPFAGDYFISCRLIDVSSAEIVNSCNLEGVKLSCSQEVVSATSKIARQLSGRTIKQQTEELRRLRSFLETLEKKSPKGDCNYHLFGDGRVIVYYPEKDILYCGYIKHGLPSGKGMLVMLGGDEIKNCPGTNVYVGSFYQGEKHGIGRLYYIDRTGRMLGGWCKFCGEFTRDNSDDYIKSYNPETRSGYIDSKCIDGKFIFFKANNNQIYIGETDKNFHVEGMGLLFEEKASDAIWKEDWR